MIGFETTFLNKLRRKIFFLGTTGQTVSQLPEPVMINDVIIFKKDTIFSKHQCPGTALVDSAVIDQTLYIIGSQR